MGKDRSKLDGSNLESHEYVMRVVPTTYDDIGGNKLVAYQYTYAYRSHISFGHGGRVIPALWFKYDLNPITVRYHEERPPLTISSPLFVPLLGEHSLWLASSTRASSQPQRSLRSLSWGSSIRDY